MLSVYLLHINNTIIYYLGGVHHFYESRRRMFNDSRPDRQERVKLNQSLKKKRGYQKRVCNYIDIGWSYWIYKFSPFKLYQRRGKCLESDKEKKMWRQLIEVYMTEESEDEETGAVRKHHMPWQSDGKVLI